MLNKLFLTITVIFAALFVAAPSLAEAELLLEESSLPSDFLMPGKAEGVGNYFEIKDSEYLNIVLESSEEIKIFLESIPKMVSLSIEAATDSATFTKLTIIGLEPNKTYYKYENSYKNSTVFESDESGNYTWMQDLTQPCHIWLQEEKSTIFLPYDCSAYGTWDATSSICTLNQNLNENVEITNSITLDCNGYKITGSDTGYGIYLRVGGVTIKNCDINNFSQGISLRYINHNIIANNNINNNYQGILFDDSSNNIIEGNSINSNQMNGVYLHYNSSRNTLKDNNINNNGSGIWLYSSGNTLKNNQISNSNIYNFLSLGGGNDIDTSNLVDGKPIYYLIGISDIVIDSSSNAGLVYCIGCNNVTIKDLTFSKNFCGIEFYSTKNSKIQNNNISDNAYCGINLRSSSNITISDNNIHNNYQGVYLYNSSTNTASNNNIYNNDVGIYLYSSLNNILSDNNIGNNINGIFLYGSNNNRIINNNISTSSYCIGFNSSSNNKIYHNNFIQNKLWLYNSSNNFFYDSYPSGGNYWSDYTGADLKNGENQDQPGSDGMGDTPYNFTGGQDKYPFMIENGWETPPEPENWSFAIITDLHIGRGYLDYDGTGYGADGEGEDYYLTERLKKVVNWLNTNKNDVDCEGEKCAIKFLAVLGDISDSGEKSEYLKAQSILNELNDPNHDNNTSDGIPYVPIFGNHDVWPYTDLEEAASSLGEEYFDEIFWDENATNTRLMKERLNFTRDETNPDFKNFTLKYDDINFIGLDFVIKATTSEADISTTTENWFKAKLELLQGKEPILLLSHQPFAKPFSRYLYVTKIGNFSTEEIEKIKDIIANYENLETGKQILGSFSGHIHGFEKFGKEGVSFSPLDIFFDANWEYPSIVSTSIISTEALMVSGNEKDLSNKGIIRIIKVNEEQEINSSTTEGKFPALNPSISFDFTIIPGNIFPCVFFKAHNFTQRDYSLIWDFEDGNTGSEIWQTHCYSSGGVYDVKLTAVDTETSEKEYIIRKVEVKEGIIPKIINIAEEMKGKLELISLELGEKVTEFGRTMKDWVLIKVKQSEAKPIGLINVHFEEVTEDIDLSNLVTDIDLDAKKVILYSRSWPSAIEKSKILFIPK